MNGCRHEQEDRKCHHPDVVKEEGYIDWCAEGPGCTRQEPDTDRIEEIKVRCELAKKVMTVLRDLDDIRGEQTIRSAAADILDNCGKDLEFLLGEIERLTAEVEEYHAWQQGKIGVEEYLELKVKYKNLRMENDRLQSELAKCTSGNGTYISIESHKYLLEKMRKSVIRQAEKV